MLENMEIFQLIFLVCSLLNCHTLIANFVRWSTAWQNVVPSKPSRCELYKASYNSSILMFLNLTTSP